MDPDDDVHRKSRCSNNAARDRWCLHRCSDLSQVLSSKRPPSAAVGRSRLPARHGAVFTVIRYTVARAVISLTTMTLGWIQLVGCDGSHWQGAGLRLCGRPVKPTAAEDERDDQFFQVGTC